MVKLTITITLRITDWWKFILFNNYLQKSSKQNNVKQNYLSCLLFILTGFSCFILSKHCFFFHNSIIDCERENYEDRQQGEWRRLYAGKVLYEVPNNWLYWLLIIITLSLFSDHFHLNPVIIFEISFIYSIIKLYRTGFGDTA